MNLVLLYQLRKSVTLSLSKRLMSKDFDRLNLTDLFKEYKLDKVGLTVVDLFSRF